jgi:hypothetical protein
MKKTFTLIFLWIPLLVSAQAFSLASLSDQKAAWNIEVGEDFWHIKTAATDLSTEIQPRSFLFLPDASPKWAYKNPHTEIKIVGMEPITQYLRFNIKFKANQEFGAKLDELALDYAISPSWGLRAGVVDYKTTWCQTYDADSPWIVAPTLACSSSMFVDTSGGAPGVQSYVNLDLSQNYNLQALVGVYNPLVLNYASDEFAQWIPSPQYQVKKNNKVGGSLNLFNTWTGTEYRLSWLHSQQSAYSPESDFLGTTNQSTDLIYAGVNFALNGQAQLQLTRTQQYLSNDCTAVYQSKCDDHLKDTRSTNTLKLLYHFTNKDVLGASFSRHQIRSQLGTNAASGIQWDNDFYREHHNGWGVAWRHQWTPQVFTAVQLQLADQSLGYSSNGYIGLKLPANSGIYASSGSALGVRLAYRFN